MLDFKLYELVLGGYFLKVNVASFICNICFFKMFCYFVSFEN